MAGGWCSQSNPHPHPHPQPCRMPQPQPPATSHPPHPPAAPHLPHSHAVPRPHPHPRDARPRSNTANPSSLPSVRDCPDVGDGPWAVGHAWAHCRLRLPAAAASAPAPWLVAALTPGGPRISGFGQAYWVLAAWLFFRELVGTST
jgi:hypothetical protein